MRRCRIHFSVCGAFLLGLLLPIEAYGQLVWRVSVKVIRDEHGLRFDETCIGGANDGVPCDPDAECPGGMCLERICSGGPDDGDPCNYDTQCPGGECIGDMNTDEEIRKKIENANDILAGNGPPDVPRTEPRGYQLDLIDIIDLTGLPAPPTNVRACANRPERYCESSSDCPVCVGGADHGDPCRGDGDCLGGTCTGTSTCGQVSHWFYAPIIRQVRNAIRDAATVDAASRALWGWDDSAINVYILGSDGSGTAYDMVLLGQDLSAPNTPFHEVGHFFNLDHTHSGGGPSPDCTSGWDDNVADTLLDNCGENCPGGCWDQDDIASYNFPYQCDGPCSYAALSGQDQLRVDQVYYNLMSYRRRREVLTPGQLDRMTDHANGTVNHVASGRTRFVDASYGGAIQIGSSSIPFRAVLSGLSAANPNDIVLLRTGTYEENLEIDQPVTLRASLGDAIIGERP